MADLRIRQSGVYAIRNTVSGRVYVGSGVKIADRWKSHRYLLQHGIHHSKTLQRSWDKHGEAAFTFEVLEVVNDPNRLIECEQHWIDTLHAACPRRGFNMSPTAGNCLGVVHTAETRAKLSAARKGVPKSAEHAAAIGAAQRGKIIPEAQRLLLSAAMILHHQQNPEAKQRMSEVGMVWGPINGRLSAAKPVSQETRAKMSATRQSERLKAVARMNIAAVQTPEAQERCRLAKMARRGMPNHNLRSMTYDQAEEARRLKADGWTYDMLVKKFGLNRAAMHRLIKRQTYTAP